MIEIDGDTHDAEVDAARDNELRSSGLDVVRFGNDDVFRDVEDVVEAIRGRAFSRRSQITRS